MDRTVTDSLRYQPGATVDASDGKIGRLVQFEPSSAPGEPAYLIVERERDGRMVRIPSTTIDTAASDENTVQLLVADVDLPRYVDVLGSAGGGNPTLVDVGEHVTVRRYEEVLEPSKHEVDAGSIAIRKRVETVPAEVDVQVGHDEVVVERVTLNQQIDAMPLVRHEGDTMIIPVVEEVLVTEKRLMLREEVRVTRRQRVETVTVRDSVRREVIDVEDRTIVDREFTPVPDDVAQTEDRATSADLPVT